MISAGRVLVVWLSVVSKYSAVISAVWYEYAVVQGRLTHKASINLSLSGVLRHVSVSRRWKCGGDTEGFV